MDTYHYDEQTRADGTLLQINSAGLMWFEKKILNGNTTNWLRDSTIWIYHRDRGPAAISPMGLLEYMIDDTAHRTDGPAIIAEDGSKEYWVDDERMTADEFFLKYGVV